MNPAAVSSRTMPQIRAAVRSWTAPGSALETHRISPSWAGDDLQVHPVTVVLAGVKRPVSGEAVDGDEGAIDHHERVPGPVRRRQRTPQFRGPGGEQAHRLAH